MKKLTFTLFLFLLINFMYGQVWTQLAEITEGSPTSPGGLGQVFLGAKMSDGNLYFRGSSNGSRRAIWKTDGTVAGTNKVVEEASTFGSNWSQIFMTEVGVLLNEDDAWKILQAGNPSFTNVAGLPDENIHQISRSTDDAYFITTQRNDQYILHSANSTLTSTTEIGTFHPQMNFISLYAGTEGVIIFSTDSFVDDAPMVYLRASGEMQTMEAYMSSLSLTLSSFTYGYIYDKFMFVSYKDEDNFFRHKVIDMSTGQVEDFLFIRDPLAYYHVGGKIIMLTEREVVSFDPETMTHEVLYDDVYPFTVSTLYGDKLYCIGEIENNQQNILEVDLSNGTATHLDGALIGNFFYNCQMLWYQDEFYYLAKTDYTYLMKYDFENNEPIVVDSLSQSTGATIGHALESVNDQLVVSLREGFLQHELYVLGDGGVSSTSTVNMKQLEVYPTVANESITFAFPDGLNTLNSGTVSIFNYAGRLVNVSNIKGHTLNVASLPAGTYLGIIEAKNERYRFQFVKQ
jgi:hypothetical protein